MRIAKESADDVWEFLESAKRAQSLGFQVIFAHDDRLGDPIILHVIPDPFIWVEVRRVRWQEEQFQTSFAAGPAARATCPATDDTDPVTRRTSRQRHVSHAKTPHHQGFFKTDLR